MSPLRTIGTAWVDLVNKHPPAAIEFTGTLLVHVVGFWLPSLFFLALDALSWPQLQRHKIQPLPRQPNHNTIRHCLINALSNQLLTTTLHLLQLIGLHYLTAVQKLNLKPTYRILPSPPSLAEFLTHIFLCTLLREAMFYYSHRLLHHPCFYTAIHAQHHRFRTPVALAALYAHPLEHIVSNVIPIAWPARFLDVHILTLWIFIAGVTIQASLAHCGYNLTGLFGWKTEVHDLHHELGRGNYGLIGVLDYVHGTRRTRKVK